MINVTKTHLPNYNKYMSYVERIYKNNWITNYGELVQELEKKLREYLNVEDVILVANGTIGLQVAYKLLGLKGQVITTPFSFVATVSSMVWEGLTPKFVDIEENSFNINTNFIEENISEEVSAIVPVHVFGNGCDVEKIDYLSKKYDLKVIYDAAHAFNVNYNGTSILNYGDISVISFHATKLFHTIEGGALIINNKSLREYARKFVNFGITGPETIECIGINGKMNEFEAAMGLCMLEEVDDSIKKRAVVYNAYMDYLSDMKEISFQIRNKCCSNNFGYFPVTFKNEKLLKQVQNKLNQGNIFPRRYFYPSLNTLNYLEYQSMPVSEEVSSRILCLPIYESIDLETIKNVSKIIIGACGES